MNLHSHVTEKKKRLRNLKINKASNTSYSTSYVLENFLSPLQIITHLTCVLKVIFGCQLGFVAGSFVKGKTVWITDNLSMLQVVKGVAKRSHCV